MHAQSQATYLISAIMFVAGVVITYQALVIYQKNELAIYGVVMMAYSIIRLYLMKRFRVPRDMR
jgi:hypothetical protein